MGRFEAHPSKPERGTAKHFDFVVERATAFLALHPDGARDAFLTAETDGGESPHATRRDVDGFPGRWSGLREWVGGQRAQDVDFSDLDFDDAGPTLPDAGPTFDAADTADTAEAPDGARVATEAADDPTPPPPTAYVFTWAQNATPLHDDFFAALRVLCEHRGAELVVLPGRYRNPTSIWSRDNESDDWWDPRLDPYLHRGRMQVCPTLIAFGDISIQPTAIRPLTGWELYAGQGHAIFGHPKIQLRTVPTATPEDVRVHVTTGAVTAPNYTNSKAGKKGEAHHVTGACYVEIDEDGDPHLRQINAESDGTFIDLGERFSPAGVEPAPRPLALITGDSHVAHAVDAILDATFRAEDSVARTLQPAHVVFHDVLDFRSRNHHEIGNPSARFEKAITGQLDNVEAEVEEAVQYVDAMTPEGSEPVVIPSNHDEAFDRWLRTADTNGDPRNASYFHEVRAAQLRHFEQHHEWVSAFELAYRQRGAGRARFIQRGEPFAVADIALGFHGDRGTNGSRGSVFGYSKMGTKTVIGHVHSPAITDGTYAVGVTAALDQGYNRGAPSSWAHAHCVLYANGKRTLIFVNPKTGRWRGSRGRGSYDTGPGR